MISVDILNKVDLRVGTIENVDDIKGSMNLVRLTVNFGDHKRQVIVGMKKERQNPEEIKGVQALFIVNLEPRKIMG